MDPRDNASQAPFPRPMSQPGFRDPRHAPIPPPSYTLQTPVRTAQPTLNHDPFLPRRQEYDDVRQGQSKSLLQTPFGLGNYAASASRDALAIAAENRDRVQDNGMNWRLGEGRMDQYGSQNGDGE